MKDEYSKAFVEARVGRVSQIADIRRYSIEDGKGRGMRAFEVFNSSGFDFVVYPDRGLDIGLARFNGKSLTWMTMNGPVAPAFYDASSAEWLRTWMGGLLTTCGWMNVGNPCVTEDGSHGIHGRMDHTPAEEVNTRCYWNDKGEYTMEITGNIVHARVFGENLVTSRTISTRLGWPGVIVIDRTENVGSVSQPLMQLYHMNFGWPLIDESTRLVAAPHEIKPRDADAEKGVAEWATMPPPTKGFAEQVIYHDLPMDGDGFCSMRIENPKFGPAVSLSFRKAELPYLVQWRQAGVGAYVMGLEPANCYPIGRNDFAKTGLLRQIEPGQVVETEIRLQVEKEES